MPARPFGEPIRSISTSSMRTPISASGYCKLQGVARGIGLDRRIGSNSSTRRVVFPEGHDCVGRHDAGSRPPYSASSRRRPIPMSPAKRASPRGSSARYKARSRPKRLPCSASPSSRTPMTCARHPRWRSPSFRRPAPAFASTTRFRYPIQGILPGFGIRAVLLLSVTNS